jgi:hypothetical protein
MKRRPFRGPATLALAALCTLALAAPASAHDDRHGDRDHRTVVVEPGESIQAAVDAARPGTKIVVKRGTYAENVVVTTDDVTLKARGAEIVPPATPGAPTPCSFGEPAGDGICVAGQLDFPPDGPPTVRDPVEDVTVKGFEIRGFAANGIVFLGAEDLVAKHNETEDDHEYGIAAFFASGGWIVGNEASGSEEAGIYVGDSPEADVTIAGNRTFDNQLFGIFLRDAADGRVVGNESSGNCVGAIVLNTGANVAGDWRFFGNRIHDNDRFCPPGGEEGAPPLSGIGIALANASGNVLIGNEIVGNEPSGAVPFTGGVVVVDARSPGAEPPSDNLVERNAILGNQPDVFWDGSGTGNAFERNLCRTSVPDGLCESRFGHRHHDDDDHGKGDDRRRHHDHGDRDHDDRDGGEHRH